MNLRSLAPVFDRAALALAISAAPCAALACSIAPAIRAPTAAELAARQADLEARVETAVAKAEAVALAEVSQVANGRARRAKVLRVMKGKAPAEISVSEDPCPSPFHRVGSRGVIFIDRFDGRLAASFADYQTAQALRRRHPELCSKAPGSC